MPARARRARSVVLPLAITTGLVATALTAAIVPASSARAAALGTFTVGDTPIALNQATDPELGTLTPTADAATQGMFGTEMSWPIIALHAAIARNGHLITYGTPLGTVKQSGIEFDDWDPSAGATDIASHTDIAAEGGYNSFCNAAVELSDGRLLMVSGQLIDNDDAEMMTMIYDPIAQTQTMGAMLDQQRWYPTALRLTDGRILLLGGAAAGDTAAYQTPDDNSKVATVPEIGTGTDAWSDLSGAASTTLFGAVDNHWWYPRAFNSPNGGVVGFSGDAIWTLDPTGNGSVQQVGTLPFNPKVSGSQVMYAPGKILIAGGGQVNNGDETAGTSQAAILDVNGTVPTATSTTSMHYGRNWLNLTVLPTGQVWADGGTLMGTDAGDANAVKQSETWDPATGSWTLGATARETRTYHSTAVLLPSGAVFTGGGGNPGPVDNFNAEIYYPSYLFSTKADGSVAWASRPAITAISGSATYGGTVNLTVGAGEQISSASLISIPVETHSQNTDQRRIPLTVSQQGTTVTTTLPSSVNTMPAGDYELTVTNSAGVPSTAQIVTIRNGAAGLVTVSEGTTATSASATATAAPSTSAEPVTATASPAPSASATTSTSTPTAGTGTSTGTSTGTGTGTTGTPAQATVALTVDQSVGLEASNRSGYRVQHAGSTVRMGADSSSSSKESRTSSSWIVRPGLASAHGVSLESVDRPGWYLVASTKSGGAVTVARNSGSSSFAGRATFAAVKGASGRYTTLQVWSHRSWVLRHRGTTLIAQPLDTSSAGRADSTFAVRAGTASAPAVPLSSGRSIGLSALERPGALVKRSGSGAAFAAVTASSPAASRTAASWIVHTVKGGVQLESAAHRGYYLAAPAHGSGTTTLLKHSGSASFVARTVFTVSDVTGENGVTRELRLAAHHSLALRHSGSRLSIGTVTDAAAKLSALFVVHSGLSPAPTR